jgi:hypothetical protein
MVRQTRKSTAQPGGAFDFTSRRGLRRGKPRLYRHSILVCICYPQLCVLTRVRMVVSRRYFVTPLARPSWSRFFEEFHCRGCGAHQAYRSRPRGFFERHVLPFLLLQAVRCERCYHRSYVLSTIPALERVPLDRKPSRSEPAGDSKSDGRVAQGVRRGYTDRV